MCACVCVCVWGEGGGGGGVVIDFVANATKRKVPSLKIRHLIDCSVASRVVVMVQWLAHPTSIQGDAGTIPTHGTHVFFHSKKGTVSSSLSLFLNSLLTHLYSKALCILWILLASDYIVGMPAFLIQKYYLLLAGSL